MAWCSVELETEVVEWLDGLRDDQFGRVEFYIGLLADRGAQLRVSPTPDNYKGSYENCGSIWAMKAMRCGSPTYFATGRPIIPLTVFRQERKRERAKIDRAV